MKLTQQILNEGMSNNGGWSNNQWRALGVVSPHRQSKGWLKDLLGTDISQDKINRFVELRNEHLKKRKKNNQECKHTFYYVAQNEIKCKICKRQYPIDESTDIF